MIMLVKEQPQLEVELRTSVIHELKTDGSHTNWHVSSGLFSNEFQGPVATDLVPPERICDWCDQAGERRFTAIGGSFHNKTGVFCSPCGQLFLEGIVNS